MANVLDQVTTAQSQPTIQSGKKKKTVLSSALNQIAKQVADAIALEETERLRKNAKEAGWPKEIADQISVVPSGKGHTVHYPEEIKNDVLTLEYGTSNVPPSPVIRSLLWGSK